MFRLWSLGYGLLAKAGYWLESPFLLVIRLYWGWNFFLSGKGKLGNLDGTTEFFTTLGLPMPKFQAILAASTECVGGLLLLIGLFSRLISIPLIITMIVAYAVADTDALKSLLAEDKDPFFKAAPFTFLMASLIIFIFGPGFVSVDRIFRKNP